LSIVTTISSSFAEIASSSCVSEVDEELVFHTTNSFTFAQLFSVQEDATDELYLNDPYKPAVPSSQYCTKSIAAFCTILSDHKVNSCT
jgi:hypothetical protein